MRKFVEKILIMVIPMISICILFAVAIDPYNVFHWKNVRENGIEPNRNYIKMKYILDNPDKFNAFLFGSSRVGVIQVQNIEEYNCYNMYYTVGNPPEHLLNIQTLFDKGIYPQLIMLGVDSLSYTTSMEDHLKEQMRAPYEELRSPIAFAKLYLDPKVSFDLLTRINKEGNTVKPSVFYEYGWWTDYEEKVLEEGQNVGPTIGKLDKMEEVLDAIREIVELCDANDVQLIVFTNPMHRVTYEASVEQDYIEFLTKLSYITDYYNFSGINDVTLCDSNFLDSSHYSSYVGDMILDVILKNEGDECLVQQGFGYFVTKKNVDEFIGIISK